MKQLITSLILLLSVTTFGQSKQDFFVGATLNKIENLDVGIGYSAGFSTRAKLTDYAGFMGTLQFSNHHTKVDDLSLDFYGIETSFFFTVYPAKESFSFLVGFTSDVKDGKSRITIDNFTILTNAGTYDLEQYLYKKDGTERTNSQATGLKTDISKEMNGFILSFEQHLLGKIDKKEDW